MTSANYPRRSFLAMLAVGPMISAFPQISMAEPAAPLAKPKENRMSTIHYRTQKVGDVEVFYREAGPVMRRLSCCSTAFLLPAICFAT